jgi:DNA-binding transcriptional LysR family regulator
MPKVSDRSAATVDGGAASNNPGKMPSWDDLRLFLHCADEGSFRRAAQLLGVSTSTLVRRIDRLERDLSVRLFDRAPDGVSLTDVGRSVLDGARQMERASFDVLQANREAAVERTATTIAVTEGLGVYWLIPQIVQFQRQHPDIAVNVRCAMESVDVLRLEADLAVQFIKPTSPDLMVVRLGRLHLYPFASRGYLEAHGTPGTAADMRRHRLINQIAPQLDPNAWARYLGVESVDDIVAVSTNSSSAVLLAIESGAGIGALPTYTSVVNRRIVPVDLGGAMKVDVWLTFRRDLRRSPRRSALIDWIRGLFDAQVHPYFGDRFVHPTELRRMIPRGPWHDE